MAGGYRIFGAEMSPYSVKVALLFSLQRHSTSMDFAERGKPRRRIARLKTLFRKKETVHGNTEIQNRPDRRRRCRPQRIAGAAVCARRHPRRAGRPPNRETWRALR